MRTLDQTKTAALRIVNRKTHARLADAGLVVADEQWVASVVAAADRPDSTLRAKQLACDLAEAKHIARAIRALSRAVRAARHDGGSFNLYAQALAALDMVATRPMPELAEDKAGQSVQVQP